MGDIIDLKTKKPIPPPPPEKPDNEHGDRIERIRASLRKINALFNELKRMSRDDGP